MEITCPRCGKRFETEASSGEVACPHCGEKLPAEAFGLTQELPPRAAAPETVESPRGERPPPGLKAPHFPESARYKLLGELGRGGMGIVYKAHDSKLNRVVALKVLIAGEGASEEDVKRFFQEATSAARMRHPNIIPIHELDVQEGRHYFTMDFVEGGPLSKLITARKLTPRRAVEILRDVAGAVHHAHEHGIIHRDLKPQNIIITPDGRPMVMDFGLAKQVASDTKLTQSGVVVGTPQYMAPEHVRGDTPHADARIDVWALGAVLYEMITGLPPFVGATSFDIVRKVVHDDPVPPRKYNHACPRDVETIALKCLEKDPRRRYQTAGQLADDCQRFLEGEPVSARPASLLYRARKRLARHKAVTAVTALATAALLSLAIWSYVRIVEEKNAAILERDRAVGAERREAEQRKLAEEKHQEADEARKQAIEAREAAEQARRREEALRERAEAALQAERQLRRLEGELDVAAEIQASLLPHKLPMIEGYDFSAWLRTATEVGGGYYDYIPLTGKRIEDVEKLAAEGAKIGLVMAQAPKKGIPGAILMSRIRTLTHAVLPETGLARESLLKINDQLMADVLRWPEHMRAGLQERAPVQMLIAVLEVDTRQVRMCNAGYEPPVVFRANSGGSESPCPRGRPLGEHEKAEIVDALVERTVVLAPGDRLVLFSEGFARVRNMKGVEYGLKRFLGTVRASAGFRSRDFMRAIVAEFERYRGEMEQTHDMVLSTVRLEPQGGVIRRPDGPAPADDRPSRPEVEPSSDKGEVF